MEVKDNVFNNNIKDNKIPHNNDSTNQNFISGKIININNNQQELYDFYNPSEKEKEKNSVIEEDLGNDKNIADILTKDLINKMTLISPIPQQNLPIKKKITENLKQEKEESFEEKDEEDITPDDEEEEEESDDSYIEDLNPKNGIKNEKEKEKENNEKNLKLEENIKINNDFDKKKENNINTNNLNRTFSYNIKDKNKKEKLNNSYITSFFYLTSMHLKEELENDHSYYSDFNNSHNYIRKINLESNYNENNISNGHSNNISNTNESVQNESLNFNVNPKIFFGVYNQMNLDKNINEKSNENENINKINNSKDYEKILNNNKNENKMNIREQIKEGGIINSIKEKINNIPPFEPKNKFKNINENFYYQNQKIINNKLPDNNNIVNFNINSNNIKKDQYLFNNIVSDINKSNQDNNLYQNTVDIQHYNKFSIYANKLSLSNIEKNNENYNTNINQKNIIIPQNYYGDLKLNVNGKANNMNIQRMKYQNGNNNFKESIPAYTNKMNSINGNINLYNINYNNNYINLINSINKNQNSKKDEMINIEQKKINSQKNNMINNNANNLNPEDYMIKMFGRLGWICCHCNNFNFDTRNRCNRCQAVKMPKLKEEIFKKKDKKNKKKAKERRTDWLCLNCKNLNYGFRKNCNRCKIERQDDFPSIYLEPNQKINDTNGKIILMNNYGKMQDKLNNNLDSNIRNNNNANNFINNNNKNNIANYSYNNSINNNIGNIANNINTYGSNDNIMGYTNYYNNKQNNN